MQKSLLKKLDALAKRRLQVNELLSKPDAANDINRFKELSKELSDIAPVVECYERFENLQSELQTAHELTTEGDPDLKELGV